MQQSSALTRADLADELYRRVKGEPDPYLTARDDLRTFFSLAVINEDDPNGKAVELQPFQMEVLEVFVDEQWRIILVIWPRGFGKSQVVAGYAAWRIGRNPNIRIIFCANMEDIAETHLARVEAILRGSAYKRIFGDLIPTVLRQPGSTWSDSAKTVIRDRLMPHPTLLAVGAASAVGLGHRCDLMVWDDVVDEQSATSPAEREHLWRWLWIQAYPALLPSGQLLIDGTRFGQEDAYAHMLSPEAEGHLIGAPRFRYIERRALEMDEEGEEHSIWPSRFPTDYLKTERAINPIAFETAFQNNPMDVAEAILREDWIEYVESEHVPWDALTYYFGVDPNLLKTPTRRRDYYALAVLGVDHAQEQGYLVDMYYGRPDQQQAVEMFRRFWHRYHPALIYFEGVGAQYFQQVFLEGQLEDLLGLTMLDSNPGNVPKPIRIRHMSRLFTQGLIKVLGEKSDVGWHPVPTLEPFIREWKVYREVSSVRDDALDAVDIVSRSLLQSGQLLEEVINPEDFQKNVQVSGLETAITTSKQTEKSEEEDEEERELRVLEERYFASSRRLTSPSWGGLTRTGQRSWGT